MSEQLKMEMSQALDCGCSLNISKADGRATITFCSEEHAFVVWMGWNENVFDAIKKGLIGVEDGNED